MSNIPNEFQINGQQSPAGDPLGILDAQGSRIILDTKTDPLGALDSPSIHADMNPSRINAQRLNAKTRNFFSLVPNDGLSVEINRSKNLRG